VSGFAEDLRYSKIMHRLPIWQQTYAQAFPRATLVLHEEDGEHQRAGIDRSIVLPNTKQLFVDEKVRRPVQKPKWPYNDILLEHVSNDVTKAPGWVCKALRADFIAYAILQTGQCFLLPVIQLQQAWELHGDFWLGKYGQRRAINAGYYTLNCPVPIDDLFRAIGGRLRFQCEPMSCEQLDLFASGAS
jgi:hypothetical protein